MSKIQTLAEMEAEDANIFKNPSMTPAQEAALDASYKAREALRTYDYPDFSDENDIDSKDESDDEGDE